MAGYKRRKVSAQGRRTRRANGRKKDTLTATDVQLAVRLVLCKLVDRVVYGVHVVLHLQQHRPHALADLVRSE